jgi:hypothetical protein
MLLNQKTELDDEETAQKEKINILFSLPVASTTPSKGKAEGVEKKNKRFCLKITPHLGGELWNFHWGVICKS